MQRHDVCNQNDQKMARATTFQLRLLFNHMKIACLILIHLTYHQTKVIQRQMKYFSKEEKSRIMTICCIFGSSEEWCHFGIKFDRPAKYRSIKFDGADTNAKFNIIKYAKFL